MRPGRRVRADRLAARTFDVVLLDLRMPGIGGLKALRRIHDEHLPCEVVILTDGPDYDDCVEAMKLGAFHYLRKPTELTLVEETFQRAVEHVWLRLRTLPFDGCWSPSGHRGRRTAEGD